MVAAGSEMGQHRCFERADRKGCAEGEAPVLAYRGQITGTAKHLNRTKVKFFFRGGLAPHLDALLLPSRVQLLYRRGTSLTAWDSTLSTSRCSQFTYSASRCSASSSARQIDLSRATSSPIATFPGGRFPCRLSRRKPAR